MTPQYANKYCESTSLSNEASVETFFEEIVDAQPAQS